MSTIEMNSELDEVFENVDKIKCTHPFKRKNIRIKKIADMKNVYYFRKFLEDVIEKIESALEDNNMMVVIEIDVAELEKTDA